MGHFIIKGYVSEFVNDRLSWFFGLMAEIESYGSLCDDTVYQMEDRYLDTPKSAEYYTFRVFYNQDSYNYKLVELTKGLVRDDQVQFFEDHCVITLEFDFILEKEAEN